MPPGNIVKLKDQPGFKRLMHLATAIIFVPGFIICLMIIVSDWKNADPKWLIFIFVIPFVFGLLVYGTFRIIYWVIDGFRQGFK